MGRWDGEEYCKFSVVDIVFRDRVDCRSILYRRYFKPTPSSGWVVLGGRGKGYFDLVGL